MKYDRLFLNMHLENLKNDREVVFNAVLNCGFNLKFASVNLRKDREIVLTTVNQSGSALRYASVKLRKDKEIALVAV